MFKNRFLGSCYSCKYFSIYQIPYNPVNSSKTLFKLSPIELRALLGSLSRGRVYSTSGRAARCTYQKTHTVQCKGVLWGEVKCQAWCTWVAKISRGEEYHFGGSFSPHVNFSPTAEYSPVHFPLMNSPAHFSHTFFAHVFAHIHPTHFFLHIFPTHFYTHFSHMFLAHIFHTCE